MENIKITFKVDGIETSVVGEKDKTVLDSAIDNDIDAPYSCRGGACATCIGKIKNGKVELEQNYILTDSELEDGLILTCQAYPKSENIYIDIDDVEIISLILFAIFSGFMVLMTSKYFSGQADP